MDSWGGLVLGIEILLLVAGWLLFQQARTELTARAAQLPVLTEVKNLQKNIQALLEQIKLESTQLSTRLETRCMEARDLVDALDRKLEEAQSISGKPLSRRRVADSASRSANQHAKKEEPVVVEPENPANPLKQEVISLAAAGENMASIAQRTGLSEGEVEMILSLHARKG